MGLGNWVKQVTRIDSAAAGPPSERPLVQPPASHLDAEFVPTAAPGEAVDGSKSGEPGDRRWVGFIDRATPTAIEGWAYDTHNPGSHVTVEAVISNGKRIVAVAHSYRKDVEDAGYGNGAYGFFLDLSKLALKDESAVVRFAESKHPISGKPIDFDAARAALTTDMPDRFFSVMGLCAAQTRQAVEALDATR